MTGDPPSDASDTDDTDDTNDTDRDDDRDRSDTVDSIDPAAAPNRATLWGRVICSELVAAGVSGVCFAPGSRSTPLTIAAIAHPEIEVFSHLDERSAAFLALGRGRRGELTALICTSGTAAAEFHPAVIEADQARVPLLVLTADRPPELADSGANQTVDQEKLYGDAVRTFRDLSEPAADPRKLRSLRVTVCRAITTARGTPAGPVHLNARFRKPLEPTEVPGDVPEDLAERASLATRGRDGPFVRANQGRPELRPSDLDTLVADLETADRGLLVAGPADPLVEKRNDGADAEGGNGYAAAIAALARTTGFPVLADPLSELRFGTHTNDAPICGGYDSYLDSGDWPDPDLVFRFGASPTSKVLRHYLRDAEARQILVDPAGGWREATFTASDLLLADPTRLARGLADRLTADDQDRPADGGESDEESSDTSSIRWAERFADAETRYWSLLDQAHDEQFFEGTILSDAAALAPDPSTLFVSNSTAVRDLDRFARPREADVTALANRGASGIDGITSSALGAGSVDSDPLVLVLGDLAYYHDMNGLLAVSRCGVDATIVLVDNDGGGIFHMLPIAEFDPPFTEGFETPHGLDFAPTGELYGLEFTRVDSREAFREAYQNSLASAGTQVIAVSFDSEASHQYRETIHERVCAEIGREKNDDR
ncbi:2-succinyl-5-enolpyruvyl-6-hydroxy-3-cyclohexene-1-carboxylic-acid synthase [Halobacteriales archaeon QS_3_64_16]|nr:MAG: 2-succinyl-5-enolpyruvyl-6-hydroxy-3-cyclohexene-1-carboxylic-acid synthase [Halobacteriales archaeon QS_3_64_16]